MKSRIFLVAFIAATAFAATQSGKLNAQTTASLTPDEEIVECDPSPSTICAIINGATFYGKYRKP